MSKEDKQVQQICSFCGLPAAPNEGRILIQGSKPGVYICSDCSEQCAEVAEEYRIKPHQEEMEFNSEDFKPSKIKEYLDAYVIGQEQAKEVLAVAVYNHYKNLIYKAQKDPNIEIEKSNVLIAGPTGSGKTYLLRILAKMLGVPLAISDATNLTAAGYVGEDVENVVRKLIEAADGDIEKAQRGIIYIDEIDKLSRKGENVSISRDVGGEGVQQALLKIIEGSEVEVPPKGGRKHPNQECIKVDTSNILFICGGAFEGIEKIIAKRQKSAQGGGLGFGVDVKKIDTKDQNVLLKDLKVEDLKKFGMVPEFLGRLPIICALEELDHAALVKILTEPKNALVKQYQELIKMDGVEIEFTNEALNEIAQKAIDRKTGARALRSIMEDTLRKLMFAIPDDPTIEKVIITKDGIHNLDSNDFVKKEIS